MLTASLSPVKVIVFVFGLFISAIGLTALVVPFGLRGLANQFDTPVEFYGVAGVRIAFGLLLISAASASRLPRVLRVLGTVIVVLGAATVLTGSFGAARAHEAISWAFQRDAVAVRIAGVVLVALGAAAAYACGPSKRITVSRDP